VASTIEVVSRTALGANETDRSLHFYRDLLGLKECVATLAGLAGRLKGDAPRAVEFEGSDGSWHFYAAFSVASSFELFARSARLSRDR
jgi:catechol 2,3-dioxygenase-like lactoylglutathione lyase family enzyme